MARDSFRSSRKKLARRANVRKSRFHIESLEARLALTWTGAPPALITPPTSAPVVRLNTLNDATGIGSISGSQINYYQFTATVTGNYIISATTPTSDLDPVLGVFATGGQRLTYNDDISSSNPDSRVIIGLTGGSKYYVGITNFLASSHGGYTWTIDGPATAITDDKYEPNNTRLTAASLGSLAAPKTIDKLVLADANDWYSFTTTRAGSSTVSLAFQHFDGDLELELYNSAGTRLGFSAGEGNTESITTGSLAIGTYFVRVYGFQGTFNPNYSLTVSPPIPPIDLYGAGLSVSGSSAWRQTVTVQSAIRNNGTQAAGPFGVQWYLSRDALASADDILLPLINNAGTTYQVAGLGAKSVSASFTATLQLPSLPPGWSGLDFYIIMKTDSADQILETNETNNFGQIGNALDRTGVHILTGTWDPLNPSNPDDGPQGGTQAMMLLSDGSVLVQAGDNGPTETWFKLTPDGKGNYVKGTWSAAASMNDQRLFFTTAMLPSGKVFAVGGEYANSFDPVNGFVSADFINTAEIYDPVADKWSRIADVPTADLAFGDDPIEVLPDGQVLAGYYADGTTFRYQPSTDKWVPTVGSKVRDDASDEETWIKLPDGSILTYDVFGSIAAGKFRAQRYIPAQDKWVDASTLDATSPPGLLTTANQGFELGPGILLPDGRVFLFGANGRTAFYNPATDLWSNGPSEPLRVINGVRTQLAATDNPAAMLPNGDVLVALSPLGGLDFGGAYTFPDGAFLYEFNPGTKTFADVTPPDLGLIGPNVFVLNMVVLPSGQVLMANQAGSMEIYTPSGSPNNAWRPVISSVVDNQNGTFTLTGTQLNGISEGSSYGDDMSTASNYPIVQLKNAAGDVFYARTSDWSSTGVATGNTAVTTKFTLPAGLPSGAYSLAVIANGIASAPVNFNTAGGPAAHVNVALAAAKPSSLAHTATVHNLLKPVVHFAGVSVNTGGAVAVTSIAPNTATVQPASQPAKQPGTVNTAPNPKAVDAVLVASAANNAAHPLLSSATSGSGHDLIALLADDISGAANLWRMG